MTSSVRTISFVIAQLSSGGAARATISLAEILVSAGYRVQIISTRAEISYSCSKRIDVIPIFQPMEIKESLINKILRRPIYLFRLLKIFRSTQPQWIVSVMWGMSLRVLIAAALVGAKSIAIEHTTIKAERSLVSFISRRFLYRFFSRVVVLTREDGRIYGRYLRNVSVIPNSISPVFFSWGHYAKSPASSIFVVTDLSRPWVKGLDYLLSVFDLVKVKVPDTRLRIACAGLQQLDEVNRMLGLRLSDPSIEMLGFLTEDALALEYRNAGAVLVTSRFEGFSLVLVEAMANGAPVISFDCDFGPREIIENGKTGFLVALGDIDSMASIALTLLTDCGLRAQISDQARASASKFHPSAVGIQWKALLGNEG